MKYLLASLGSAGDLHPYLMLARALREQGHDVELMSNAPYRGVVESEGVRFQPLCSSKDHDRTAQHPDLWHPVRGFGVLWRHLAVPAIEPVLRRIDERLAQEGPGLVVLASPLAVGARLADAAGRPVVLGSVYTAPANLRPLEDPCVVGPWRMSPWTPAAARRALWWTLDRWKLEPMARPRIEKLCAELGAPRPVGSLFGRWLHSPRGGVALFPADFGPAAAPWVDGQIVHADFPRYRAVDDVTLHRALQDFLDAGEPPVVIFGGSQPGPQGLELVRASAQACRALGHRHVVLIAAAAAQRAGLRIDDSCLAVEHAPLSRLLPRAVAFVHHAGVGSCAEGLASGIPQIVTPFAFDQFDNAARLEARHAAVIVPRRGAWRLRLLEAIRTALQLPQASPTKSPQASNATRTLVAAVEDWRSRQ